MEYVIEERQLQPQPTAVEHFKIPVSGISQVIGPAYMEVADVVAREGGEFAGPPFARYNITEPPGEGQPIDFEAGFPVRTPIEPSGKVEPDELPGGTAIVTMHVGPYDAMGAAYDALRDWMDEHKREPNGPPWEVYYSDPQAEPDPATWRTEVVQPLV